MISYGNISNKRSIIPMISCQATIMVGISYTAEGQLLEFKIVQKSSSGSWIKMVSSSLCEPSNVKNIHCIVFNKVYRFHVF